MNNAKYQHGGARPGAGRKPQAGSVVRRIPLPVAVHIDALIEQYRQSQVLPLDARFPADSPSCLNTPLYEESVRAGFPSPAQGYVDKTLDLNEHLISNPPATFFLTVSGDSMIEAGIDDGDILIVDRSKTPKSGSIVIASVDGDFTVKTLHKKNGQLSLHPANPNYPVIAFAEEGDNQIIGVVCWVIKKCMR